MSFQEEACEKEERDGRIIREGMGPREGYLFKMWEVSMCLHTEGKEPAEDVGRGMREGVEVIIEEVRP